MLQDRQRREVIRSSRPGLPTGLPPRIFQPPDEDMPEEAQLQEDVHEPEEGDSVEIRPRSEDPFLRETPERKVRTREETDTRTRLQAHRVAQLKIGFFRSLIALSIANLAFFFLSFFEVQPTGNLWFIWPLGFSLLAVVHRYFRAYILKGRSLQGYIEALESRIEEKELDRGTR